MLAWPFHIILDFPFHSKEYFPTKIIWPVSDFSFDGIRGQIRKFGFQILLVLYFFLFTGSGNHLILKIDKNKFLIMYPAILGFSFNLLTE